MSKRLCLFLTFAILLSLSCATVSYADGAEGYPEYYPGILQNEYYDTIYLDDVPSGLRGRFYDRFEYFAFNFGMETPVPQMEYMPDGLYSYLPDPENYSIRWKGYLKVDESAIYKIKAVSDDGVRVYVDNNKILEHWKPSSLELSVSEEISLEAGTYYPITIEYMQGPLNAAIFLFYEKDGVNMGLIPGSMLFCRVSATGADFTGTYPLLRTGNGLRRAFWEGEDGNEMPWDEPFAYNRPPDVVDVAGNVDYAWGFGAPEGIDTDVFFGQYSGVIVAKLTGNMTISFLVDDAIEVYFVEKYPTVAEPVLKEWGPHSDEILQFTVPVIANSYEDYNNNTSLHMYYISIRYADFGLAAKCIMSWQYSDDEGNVLMPFEVVPGEFLYN